MERTREIKGNSENLLYTIDPQIEEVLVMSRNDDTGAVHSEGFLPLKEFYNELGSYLDSDTNKQSTPILPNGSIYYSKEVNNRNTYHFNIIEIPPTIVNICVDNSYYDSEDQLVESSKSYDIATPYLYFGLGVKQVKNMISLNSYQSFVAASPKAVRSSSDPLYYAPLHNLHSDGRVCWGGVAIDTSTIDKYSEYVKNLVQIFFDGKFNNDLVVYAGRKLLDNYIDIHSYYEKYAELTKEIPDFMLNPASLYLSSYTLGSFIRNLEYVEV